MKDQILPSEEKGIFSGLYALLGCSFFQFCQLLLPVKTNGTAVIDRSAGNQIGERWAAQAGAKQ
jgi:hypothetical protein